MLDSRDRLRVSDEDAEKHVRKRVNSTTRADRRSVREFPRKLEKSQSKDSWGGKGKHKEIEVLRLRDFVPLEQNERHKRFDRAVANNARYRRMCTVSGLRQRGDPLDAQSHRARGSVQQGPRVQRHLWAN